MTKGIIITLAEDFNESALPALEAVCEKNGIKNLNKSLMSIKILGGTYEGEISDLQEVKDFPQVEEVRREHIFRTQIW